ncbi:MAG TPA: ankyrin repeat domain-containing protein [Candidatus Limnocylindrales bacterium]
MPEAADPGVQLIAAVVAGDLGAVESILGAYPAAATARSAEGVSALMLAHYHARRDIAGRIRADVEALDVHEAATVGAVDRLRELLDADPELVADRSTDGFTALHFAAFFGDAQAAALLLERGADAIAVAANPLRVTPLHSASASRNHAVARLLLDRGADPNARENGGYTALHTAADNGDDELVELLLARGGDPGAAAEDGRTPADVARDKGHVALASRLTRG